MPMMAIWYAVRACGFMSICAFIRKFPFCATYYSLVLMRDFSSWIVTSEPEMAFPSSWAARRKINSMPGVELICAEISPMTRSLFALLRRIFKQACAFQS